MPIDWGPKITPATESAPPCAPPTADPAQRPAVQAMDKPTTIEQPGTATIHPSHKAPDAGPALFEKEIARIVRQLAGAKTARLDAADQALRMCGSYAMRRSRGVCKKAQQLCEEVAQHVPERAEIAKRMSEILGAEGRLHELSAGATLAAARQLLELLDEIVEPTT